MAEYDGKNILSTGDVSNVGRIIIGDNITIVDSESRLSPLEYLKGLPTLPDDIPFPPAPYIGLHWFTRSEARIFFGRGDKIKQLFEALSKPGGRAVTLLYGQSGVGKSSLLHAGLLPRLEPGFRVHYLRREYGPGLVNQVKAVLDDELTTRTRRVIIIDQLEEIITQPNPAHETEALSLARLIAASGQETRWLLGFRKEYLAELTTLLDGVGIFPDFYYLEPLQRKHVLEAVSGVSIDPDCRDIYHLELSEGVAEAIAHDLSRDKDAHLAPALQILMTKLWQVATGFEISETGLETVVARLREKGYPSSKAEPKITLDHFELLVAENGILMDDFIGEQLKLIGKEHPEWLASGLLLDLLRFFTTELGTARNRSVGELKKEYAHIAELSQINQALVDRYLLFRAGDEKDNEAFRLAHDALAPLIRSRYARSPAPGPKALIILESRLLNNNNAQSAPLDKTDLKTVIRGKSGMRAWNEEEKALVSISQNRRRRRAVLTGVITSLIGILLLGIAYASWQISHFSQEQEAQLLENKGDEFSDDPVAQLEAYRQSMELSREKDDRRQKYYRTLRENLFPTTLLRPKEDIERPYAAAFSPGARDLVLLSKKGERHTALRYLWEGPDGGFRLAHEMENGIHNDQEQLLFSADGATLASGGYDHEIHVWNLGGRKRVTDTLPGKTSITLLALSDKGGLAATKYSNQNELQIHDVDKKIVVANISPPAKPTALAFLSATEGIVVGHENGSVIHYALNGKLLSEVFSTRSAITTLRWSGESQTLFIGSATGDISLLNLTDKWVKRGTTVSFREDRVLLIEPSPTNDLVFIKYQNEALVVALEANSYYELNAIRGEFLAASFSADGENLVTVRWDGRVAYRPVDHLLPEVRQALPPEQRRIVLADDKLIMWTYNHNLLRWPSSTPSAEKFATPLPDGHASASVTALEAAGDYFVSGDEYGQVLFSSSSSGQSIAPLKSIHTERVKQLLMDRSGSVAISVSDDRQIIGWNTNTGDTLGLVENKIGAQDLVALSPDGSRLAIHLASTGRLTIRHGNNWRKTAHEFSVPSAYEVKQIAFLDASTLVIGGSNNYGIFDLSGQELDEIAINGSVIKTRVNAREAGPLLALVTDQNEVLLLNEFGYAERRLRTGHSIEDLVMSANRLWLLGEQTVSEWRVAE